jgi:hypothetical protein
MQEKEIIIIHGSVRGGEVGSLNRECNRGWIACFPWFSF